MKINCYFLYNSKSEYVLTYLFNELNLKICLSPTCNITCYVNN